LAGVRDLFHCIMAVLNIDLFTFLSEKSSPILLSPTEQLPLLRNRFTKEILSNAKEKSPALPPICPAAPKSFESHFVSDEMLEDVPYYQVCFFRDVHKSSYNGNGILKMSYLILMVSHTFQTATVM
jgi:hypothetical protein